METRTLGTDGLVVSAIGYGCMGLEAVYGPATVVRREFGSSAPRSSAVSPHFDTAGAYGPFLRTRCSVGEALAPIRNQVSIAAKLAGSSTRRPATRTGGWTARPDHIRHIIDAI